MSTKVTAATLARDAVQFLAFKRAMGMGYRRAEFVLDSFIRFVRGQYGEHPASLEQAVTRWVSRIEGRKAITVGNEFGIVRQLCLFRRRSDPNGFVPDHAVAPVKESVFVPYIFSREEVVALVDAATRHEGRSMWGAMLRALTLVLYCTGMRLGEATRLRMVDVDLRRAVLTVQRSKGRSRILAIRDDLAIANFDDALGVVRNRVIVRHQDDGVPFRVQLREDLHDLLAGAAVECAGRLVSEDHLAAVHQCARNAHALLLAAGKLPGFVAEAVAHSEPRENLLRPLVALRAREPCVNRWHFRIAER